MRTRVMGIGMGVALGMGLAAAAAPAAAAFSVSYSQKTTHGREVFDSKVAMKDEMFRMEATVDGQASVILRNQDGTFMVMVSEGMAMKMPMLNASQQPVRGADNYEDYLRQQHAERIGFETIDGHACDIYKFTDPETRGATTAWVWTEKMFPIRLEVDGPDGLVRTEISNLQVGANVPDTDFQLPAGVQVMDMGAMMQMGR